MLVFTRRLGETIILESNIAVTVMGVDRDRIKLGIVAPREKPVHRLEIYERIQQGIPQGAPAAAPSDAAAVAPVHTPGPASDAPAVPVVVRRTRRVIGR